MERHDQPHAHVPRSCPNLLANTLAKGEVLPNVTRALNFRMTVRDNRAGGGGVVYGALGFNVTTAAGPFVVTSPDTNVGWAPGSSQTVTWNVANTTAAPVSCASVDILLSTDGGNTFPTTLVAGTPNDGSQSVNIPNTPTTTARVKVKCSSSVFFDISNTNFTIGAVPGPTVVTPTRRRASRRSARRSTARSTQRSEHHRLVRLRNHDELRIVDRRRSRVHWRQELSRRRFRGDHRALLPATRCYHFRVRATNATVARSSATT